MAAVVIAALMLANCGGSGTHDDAITNLPPTAGEVEGWTPVGAAQVFDGEGLFDLINGGAEIYHEFGFRRALSEDYAGAEQRLIALEIFEMEDADAAYGVYSFKSSGNGRPLELGDDAMLEDYYLNLRKGRFVVTLTGMSAGEGADWGLLEIARAVADKIQESGEEPAIVTDLEGAERKSDRSYYMRGELALANVAPFAVGIRFGMTEGAAVRFGDHTELVLRYPDANQARQQFGAIVRDLDTRFGVTPVEDVDWESAVFTDSQGTRVQLGLADDAIVAVMAGKWVEADDTLGKLVSRFTGSAATGER